MPVLAIHGGGDLGSPISAAQDYLTSLVEPSKTFIGSSEAGLFVAFATPDDFAMHVLTLFEYMCNEEYAPMGGCPRALFGKQLQSLCSPTNARFADDNRVLADTYAEPTSVSG